MYMDVIGIQWDFPWGIECDAYWNLYDLTNNNGNTMGISMVIQWDLASGKIDLWKIHNSQ